MPELPEVEAAAVALRAVAVGKSIVRVRRLHASHRRQLGVRAVKRLIGDAITGVERRGKHQLIRLASGATLVVHFRMTGDWEIGRVTDMTPRFARVLIDLSDGTRVALTDMRALSTIALAMSDAVPGLGPDPTDPGFSAAQFRARLAGKRTPIKVALLDQRVIAGVGNIYAAEALWRAKINPRREARSLTGAEVRRLLNGLRAVMRVAGRYSYREGEERFAVYDRAGQPCRRCGTTIERFTQAGRSTYWCPYCQRALSPTPRAVRP
jgi:formamidopyrimidine-DNA glycosylase